ncbi:fluoride efflux transporter FluC [Roseinatronobacter sp.]
MHPDLTLFVSIAAGGGLGAMARAALSSWIARRMHLAWGTLAVNLSGSAMLGLAFGMLLARSDGAPLSAIAAGTPPVLAVFTLGILGGYTTVSTLALQTLTLWQAGDRRAACANALGSAVSGPVVAGLGVVLGAWLLSPAVWGG